MQREPDIDVALTELGDEVRRLVDGPTAFREDEFAGLGRRIAAFLLDTTWYVLSFVAVFLLLAATVGGGEFEVEGAGAFLLTFGWSFLWEVAWIASPMRGKPGQRMAGFRVVRPDGSRVSLARAAVRWATRMLAWLTVGVTLVVSAALVAATGRRQALHDLVAQTVCVRSGAIRRIREPQFAGSLQQEPGRAAPARPLGRAPGDEHRHTGPFV